MTRLRKFAIAALAAATVTIGSLASAPTSVRDGNDVPTAGDDCHWLLGHRNGLWKTSATMSGLAYWRVYS